MTQALPYIGFSLRSLLLEEVPLAERQVIEAISFSLLDVPRRLCHVMPFPPHVLQCFDLHFLQAQGFLISLVCVLLNEVYANIGSFPDAPRPLQIFDLLVDLADLSFEVGALSDAPVHKLIEFTSHMLD